VNGLNMALALLGILLMAALTEALVEYFISPWLKREGAEYPEREELVRTMLLRYSAAGVGVFLCIVYGMDMLAMVGLTSGILPIAGPVATGLLIGRGSNFINDFAEKWLRPMMAGGDA